jgi:hypothetical protein
MLAKCHEVKNAHVRLHPIESTQLILNKNLERRTEIVVHWGIEENQGVHVAAKRDTTLLIESDMLSVQCHENDWDVR